MTCYVKRRMWLVNGFGFLSFLSIAVSTTRFVSQGYWLVLFLVPLGLLACSIATQLQAGIGSRDFDLTRHRNLTLAWPPPEYPSVDVLLPVCGEDIDVLLNTWRHVAALDYPNLRAYVLDDRPTPGLRQRAEELGLNYLSRPNPGWFSKAGNIRYGYEQTSGEFILVLDADFCPRPDFLQHALPYLLAEPGLGILQTPQYFQTTAAQGWLERGACAVQEMFYRVVQVSRQHCDAAICVGTNALYRRTALDANGGTSLVAHSEDVHTGFDLRRHGWSLRYVPLNLAAGLCPDSIGGFFRQQYRWCAGSISLLTSTKFWSTPLPLRTRLCYLSGCFYYVYTALVVFLLPLTPAVMLAFFPQHVRLLNYVVLAPALLWNYVLFGRWHVCSYRLETFSVRLAYGWAHLFAIVDLIRGRPMQWTATGARSSERRLEVLLLAVLIVGVGGGGLVVAGSIWRVVDDHYSALQFAPLACLSLLYLYFNLRLGRACLAEREAVVADAPRAAARGPLFARRAHSGALGRWPLARAGSLAGGLLVLAAAVALIGGALFAPAGRTATVLNPSHQLLGVATDDADYASWNQSLGGHVSIRMEFISWSINYAPAQVLDGPGIPMITWQPWKPTPAGSLTQGAVQPKYSNKAIASGKWDGYLRRWALAVKAYHKPVIIRLMHEFNGTWYPWSHDPHEYVLAWRHIWNLFHKLGATNVTWVWSYNPTAISAHVLRRIAPYWPGRRYVNALGTTALQFEPYLAPADYYLGQLARVHRRYHLPTMVTESNAPLGHQNKWLRGFYKGLAKMPYNEAFVWSQLPSNLQAHDPTSGTLDWNIRNYPGSAKLLTRLSTLKYKSASA